MAIKRITQLPLDTAVTGPDVVPIVSDGATKRVTLATLSSFFATATGPTGAASTVTGPTGPSGSPSTVTGPTGPQGSSVTGPTGPGGASSWNDITDKPSTFTPSAHTHTLSDITDAGTAAASDATDFAAASDFDQGVKTTDSPTFASGYFSNSLFIGGGPGLFCELDSTSLTTDRTILLPDSDGTLVVGSDARLTDARTPTSHTHGNITNAGAIGSTSGQIVVTGASGVLTTSATISAGAVSGLAAIATSGSASDLSAGTVPFARLPVGTGSTQVAAGNDSRFTDTRTPTDGSVTDAKITTGGLSASSINWVAIQPWAANTAYAKGDLVSNAGIAYRRSAAGTSGATFNIANWQQITPSEFVASQITSGTLSDSRLSANVRQSSDNLFHPFLLAGM